MWYGHVYETICVYAYPYTSYVSFSIAKWIEYRLVYVHYSIY